MKRAIGLLLLSVALTATLACASAPETAPQETASAEVVAITAAPVITAEPTATPVPTPTPTPEPQNRSITSGRIVPDGTLMRPFIMSIDNADGAKPQTSLDKADIIYEFMVEASITRFQALFNDNYPVYAGPLRSIRYYFFDLAQEWDAMYLGSGYVVLKGEFRRIGSKILTNNLNPSSIVTYRADKGALDDYESVNGDKFRSNEPDRNSVHSLYIRVQSVVNKFYQHVPAAEERFRFLENVSYENGEPFSSVSLLYASKNIPDWIQFVYDAENNRLYRFENGSPFMNRVLSEDGTSYVEEQLSVQNLIVQHTAYGYVPNDGKGRRSCELIGTGACDYFINGQHLTGSWSRPSAEDYTQYLLDDGSLVILEPGNTWIAVHPSDREITIYS